MDNFDDMNSGGFSQDNKKDDDFSSDSKINKQPQTSSVRPITIKQGHDSEGYDIDGQAVGTVVIYGLAVKWQDTELGGTELTVDDGTGWMNVRITTSQTKDGTVKIIEDGVQGERVYVKVIGKLTGYQNKELGKQIYAYKIEGIKNFNDITCHFLEVMKSHLHFTKKGGQKMSNDDSSMNEEVNKSKADTLRDSVLKVLKSTNAPLGPADVAKQLPAYSSSEIEEALQTMAYDMIISHDELTGEYVHKQ